MTSETNSPDFIAFGSNRVAQRNEPAELSALGCFLRDESRIADALGIAPAKCWRSKHSFIATEYERRLIAGESLDGNLVVSHLAGEFPQVDQLATEAYESVPHAGNALHFARLIAEADRQYRAMRATEDFVKEIDHHCDFETVVSNHIQDLQRLTESAAADGAMAAPEGIADVMALWDNPQARGLATGFFGLDQRIGGWQPGRLYVIAAPTGIGKSALAANSAWYVARTGSVLFCSLEMPRVEVFERGLSAELRLSSETMRDRLQSPEDGGNLSAAMNLLSQRQMYVDDRTGRNIAQIASQVRKHKRKHGLDLLVVDYIQLVTPTDGRVARHEQIGAISRGLKLIAKNMEVPVIALSQLSRAGSADGIRPQLHHLRESGSIEQDSDVVMFIHRERKSNEAELLIEKNRSGPTGMVKLYWRPEFVRFDEAAITGPEAEDFR